MSDYDIPLSIVSMKTLKPPHFTTFFEIYFSFGKQYSISYYLKNNTWKFCTFNIINEFKEMQNFLSLHLTRVLKL